MEREKQQRLEEERRGKEEARAAGFESVAEWKAHVAGFGTVEEWETEKRRLVKEAEARVAGVGDEEW